MPTEISWSLNETFTLTLDDDDQNDARDRDVDALCSAFHAYTYYYFSPHVFQVRWLQASQASQVLPSNLNYFSLQDFRWIEDNDPVMGGVSTNCTFDHDKDNQLGIFRGVVQDVPSSSLKAPGTSTWHNPILTSWMAWHAVNHQGPHSLIVDY